METIHELIESYLENQDKSILGKILEQLKTTKSLWTVLVRATNNFYLGIEHEKPAAYLFTDKEYADNFVREVKWSGIESKCLEIKPEARIAFFNDLYRSGFEAVAVDQGEDSFVTSLFAIIDKNPADADGQVVMNPSLVRAANQFYQELARKRAVKQMQDVVCREIFKAKLLLPVERAASETGERKLVDRTENQTYPALTTQDGKKYLPVFSDLNELSKYDKKRRFDAVVIGFADFKKLMRKVDGIALNPFGFNLLMDREKMESIQGVSGNAAPASDPDSKVISLNDRR